MNFPNPPSWWQCCVSLPDEADKVLVGREGGLLFDFEREGAGHREFRTVIEPVLPEGAKFLSQDLLDPKVPVVTNSWDADGVIFETEVFAVAPPDAQFGLPPAVDREGGEEETAGWDGPKIHRVKKAFFEAQGAWGPEFRDAAWSDGEIVYVFRVPPGATRSLALGFGEGARREPGRRVLRVEADGADPADLDPVAVFGAGAAGILRVDACDPDGDGFLRVRISAAPESPDRSAFVSAIWMFDGPVPMDEEIFSGRAASAAFVNCGRPALPRRRFLMRVGAVNPTGERRRFAPALRVRTLERVRSADTRAHVGNATEIVADETITETPDGTLEVPPVELPPGGKAERIFAFDRNGYAGVAVDPCSYSDARSRAVAHWSAIDLPYGKIEIPDARIQALVESSIRNIYQARDIERGLPAFHVGPTCYRQLWIVDGAFLLELVTMLGRADEARAGIAYILGFQEDDGGFQLKARYWKETGIVLWAVVRQAVLTGDREWLRAQWPKVVRAVDFILRLRGRERAGDPAAPEFRLAPFGDIDGGISNMGDGEKLPEYSNVYWLLIGLKAALEAARWLELRDEEAAWATEYADFLAAFRTASAGDIREDQHGNRYLPVRIGADDPPQKAQWAFCHAVHPGNIFAAGDPFVAGMLAMLDATAVERLVFDTGWMKDGLWTYFASFIGHAHLWQGNPAAALAQLEAFADHAAPVLVWREEQKPAGQGHEEVGDMPHNWASAEFVRLAFHLVALERGDELHLFHGVPPAWIRPGATVAIRGAATAFGPLTATIRAFASEILVDIAPLSRPCAGIVVHRTAWDPAAPPIRFAANCGTSLRIEKPPQT